MSTGNNLPSLYTIGAFGFGRDQFFSRLQAQRIDTFIDIRRRRGVRGAEFSFVNSQRLQDKLKDLGIRYLHVIGLAPTDEMRKLQAIADETTGVAKRQRRELAPAFATAYTRDTLDRFDFDGLLNELNRMGTLRAVLFCVEKRPEACHRTLVAHKLRKVYGVDTIHL